MITKEELKNYSKELGFNLGQTEKNYFHCLFLFALSKIAPEKFIFKGGTSLMICYNLDRFSEDLDFNLLEEFDEKKFFEEVNLFLKKYDVKFSYNFNKQTNSSISYILHFEGPLYIGTVQSACKIELDFSQREDLQGLTNPVKVTHIYNEFPIFYVNVLSLEEIFAEKVRTIMTRNKARDVYDMNYLVSRNVFFNLELINKKLSVYSMKYDFDEFVNAIEKKRGIWEKEMKYLVRQFDDFDNVKRRICDYFKKIS